jgi:hypothetical protein
MKVCHKGFLESSSPEVSSVGSAQLSSVGPSQREVFLARIPLPLLERDAVIPYMETFTGMTEKRARFRRTRISQSNHVSPISTVKLVTRFRNIVLFIWKSEIAMAM